MKKILYFFFLIILIGFIGNLLGVGEINVEYKIKNALEYLEQENFEKAINNFEKAINNWDEEKKYNLTKEKVINKLELTRKANQENLVKIGVDHYKQKNYKEAVRNFEKAIQNWNAEAKYKMEYTKEEIIEKINSVENLLTERKITELKELVKNQIEEVDLESAEKTLYKLKQLTGETKGYLEIVEKINNIKKIKRQEEIEELKLIIKKHIKDVDIEQASEKLYKLNVLTGETEEYIKLVNRIKELTSYITYDDLARYPEDNKNEIVGYRGKVIQVISRNKSFRVGITEDKYRWRDTVYLRFNGELDYNILEGDIIYFIGLTKGEHKGQTVLGAGSMLPEIESYYIELIKKRD